MGESESRQERHLGKKEEGGNGAERVSLALKEGVFLEDLESLESEMGKEF